MQKRDYLIVGQGLAGSALAWELMQRGRSVMVYDQPAGNRASSIAAGLFNPITGRVMTKTWKASEIFPFLQKFYGQAEKSLRKKFLCTLPSYRPFISSEERNQWKIKSESAELQDALIAFHEPESFAHQAYDPFGGIEIAHSGYLQVDQWISAVGSFLKDQDSLREEQFQEQELSMDSTDGLIHYCGDTFKKICFCNGVGALTSHWFAWAPVKPLKGEILDVRIHTALDKVYNHGVYLVPSAKENTYKVGATYAHAPFLEGITPGAREELENKLKALIRLPHEIIHQDWGIRPTTPDRRPLLGSHPENKNVVIFNGLGTKGVSLAPYFAHQLSDWLEGKGDLSAEVNINRFKALYSK